MRSVKDLTIVETSNYILFYHITTDEEVYFGKSSKKRQDMTIDEYVSALKRILDDQVHPKVPQGMTLTLAPEGLDETLSWVKRTGLNNYESRKGLQIVAKALLKETVIMEQISKTPHPHLIKYHGCRVRRGCITAIVLECLNQTVTQFSRTPAFQELNKTKFFAGVHSAVEYLHSLGLAHNDISSDNIMVREYGSPVLLDFDSCGPEGERLDSLGTPGWYEEVFFTSAKEHDLYSPGVLKRWLEKPE